MNLEAIVSGTSLFICRIVDANLTSTEQAIAGEGKADEKMLSPW